MGEVTVTPDDRDCAIEVINDWGQYRDTDEAAKIVAHHRTTALAEKDSTLTTAQAEIEALRARVAELEAEMARRDANENRNCINWGPCSRHDKRMSDPDEYSFALSGSKP